MNLTRYFREPVLRICRKSHTKAFHISAYRTTSSSALAEIKFRPYKSSLKVITKKPNRAPFVARFIVGEIDEDLFEFPELDGEDLNRLNDMASVVEGFFHSHIHKVSDANALKEIPEEVLKGLKSLGLFGQTVPKLYGGLELRAFEMNRFAEIICQNPAIFHLINFHNIYGVNIMLSAGTEAQKQHYLPKLASGESTLGICIWEKNCGGDLSSIETKAIALDSDSYFISGTKVWVNNVDISDTFLVLADVSPTRSKNNESNLTFFLVNKNSPGVTVKKVEKNSLEQLSTYEVCFNDTIVKSEQIVGQKGSGFELANNAIFPRTSVMPVAVAQTIKILLKEVVNHVTSREQFGEPLFNLNSIQSKLAEVSMRLYALESMAYLTAGLYDEYEDQNTVVECAISKVYALETLQFSINIFSDLFASRLLERDFTPSHYLKDIPFFHVCEGTKDTIKLHISLHCLRYLGQNTYEKVYKLRNPLYFPTHRFKEFLASTQQLRDNPTLKHVIAENVHPSLKATADSLEYCIQRLTWAADCNIIHYGLDITQNQQVMICLADILTECYAMAATIARASRSYCIGIKNAEFEMMTAVSYTTLNLGKVRQLVEYLDTQNPPIYLDTLKGIAEATGIKKGFFAEHPTQRTYM